MGEEHIDCGAYRLLEPIGSGGMGEVWRARHRATGFRAAVKIMDPGLAAYDRYVEWFHREIRAHARLEHPNVVALYDLGEVSPGVEAQSEGRIEAGSPFYAMEYAPGGTLRTALAVGNWSTLESILRQILAGLAFAHSRDVVHRDLKPANILHFGEDETRVKLSDFGLAFEVLSGAGRRGEGAGTRVGTVDYMAPEQLRGEWRRYGPWTDLYAVGCIAFELATGRRPYPGSSPEEIATGHLAEPIPEIDPLFSVPAGLGDWIGRLLRKEPQRRYWTAADAARELERRAEGFAEPEAGEPVDEMRAETEGRRGDPSTTSVESLDWAEYSSMGPTTVVSAVVPAPALEERRGGGPGEPGDEGRRVWTDEPPGGTVEFPDDWRRPRREELRPPEAPLGLFGLREVPFVGRESERDRLWEMLGSVVERGDLRAALVTGALGSGTSRLVEWVARRGTEFGVCTLLRVSHSAIGGRTEGVTGMLQEIFNTWEMSRGDVRRQLERTLEAWYGDEVDETSLELEVRALTEILRPVGGQAGEWTPTYRFANLTERMAVVERVVRELASRRPVFLWFDDIHWSSTSLAFVRYLLEESPAERLMIGMTAPESRSVGRNRRSEVRELAGRDGVEHLELEPLEGEAHRELVERLLPLEDSLLDEVADWTAGSPLFTVELLRDWVEQEGLELVDGSFRLREEVDEPFVDDLDALWTRRFERTVGAIPSERAEDARRCIELAAVLGRHIDGSVWRVACRQAGLEASEEVVDRMFGQGLAEPTPSGWTFVHQQFVETLTDRVRRAGRYERFSVACAEALEHCYPSQTRETAARRAEYLREGGALERALEVYRAAVVQASMDREDVGEAKRLLEERDEILEELDADDSHEERAHQLSLRIALALDFGRTDQAEAMTDELLERAGRQQWASLEADALVRRSAVEHRKGNMERALNLLDRADGAYRALGETRGLARIHFKRAVVETWIGEYDAAIEDAETGKALFRELGAEVEACKCELWRIYALIYQSRYERAEHAAEELREYARRIGHRGTERESFNQLGEIARYREDWERARHCYRRFRELNDQLGLFDAVVGELNIGLVEIGREDYGAAVGRFDALLEKARERGASHLEPTIQLGRLVARAGSGEWSEWFDLLEEVRRTVRTNEAREPDQSWLLERAAERVSRADRPDALEALRGLADALEVPVEFD